MRLNQDTQLARTGPRTTPPLRFGGRVMDLAIADKNQVELFAAVGRTRGLFHGVIDWPYLNDVIGQRSAALLEREGEEVWNASGGTYGDDGKATFLPRSPVAAEVIQEIAVRPGGFVWADFQDVGWAVSLVPSADREPHSYAGLAISWCGGGRLIDPLAREEYRRAVEEQIATLDPIKGAERRKRLQQIAERVWLYERGEQLLWLIHWAVLVQRKSVVLLPDILLGQAVWGGERRAWPVNWRGTLFDILSSLSLLHAARLRISSAGWCPRFGMRSVAVAHVEHVEQNRGKRDACGKGCPLWSDAAAHGHFLVQIGYGFLGLLEHFATSDDEQGRRHFDFRQDPQGEQGKVVRMARQEGQVVRIHLPTKIFGPSSWSGLGIGHRRIIHALVNEVTRVPKGQKSERQDRAAVLIGNEVLSACGKREIVCPLLQQEGRYVEFNGNGRRAGLGYRIMGSRRRGWLAKCGYGPSVDRKDASLTKGNRSFVLTFLNDLANVANILGLVVAGIHPRTGMWLSLEAMRKIAQVRHGDRELDAVHLRVYGQEDYLDRCRDWLIKRGSFALIPGRQLEDPEGEEDRPEGGESGFNLRLQMRQAGLTQRGLAQHLGVSEPFVSKVMNEERPWPERMRERAERFVAGVSEGISGREKVVARGGLQVERKVSGMDEVEPKLVSSKEESFG